MQVKVVWAWMFQRTEPEGGKYNNNSKNAVQPRQPHTLPGSFNLWVSSWLVSNGKYSLWLFQPDGSTSCTLWTQGVASTRNPQLKHNKTKHHFTQWCMSFIMKTENETIKKSTQAWGKKKKKENQKGQGEKIKLKTVGFNTGGTWKHSMLMNCRFTYDCPGKCHLRLPYKGYIISITTWKRSNLSHVRVIHGKVTDQN